MAAQKPSQKRPRNITSRIEPVDLDALASEAGEQEMIPVFIIDGVEYCIPSEPPANVVLKYLRAVRTQGQEVAAGLMVEAMLGEAGYEALMNYDRLTVAQLNTVMRIIERHVMGAAERTGGIGSPLAG